MGITVDYLTRNVNIARNDLTRISVDPEIRELDVNDFRSQIKAIEASEEGIVFDDMHENIPPPTVGGITYSRFVIMMNGYRPAFEDGQYSVNLLNANNNIVETKVVNQVSVVGNNSGGAIVINSESSGGGGEATIPQSLLDDINSINTNVGSISSDISSLSTSTQMTLTRINSIDANVVNINTNIQGINTNVQNSNTTIEGISTSVEEVNTTVTAINTSIEGISTNVGEINADVDTILTNIGSIDSDIQTANTTIETINTSVNEISIDVEFNRDLAEGNATIIDQPDGSQIVTIFDPDDDTTVIMTYRVSADRDSRTHL